MNKRRKRQSENVGFEREKCRLAADTIEIVDGTRGMSSRLIAVRRTPSSGRDELPIARAR